MSSPGVPAEIRDLIVGDKVSDITCAAFGSSRDAYFFAYRENGDTPSFKMATNNLPAKLYSWLMNEDEGKATSRDKHIKAVLGTNDSFVAWDSSSIRWSNIPDGMEQAIQSWLSPSGWVAGPPRILTWSIDGSWLAVSEYGQNAWSIPVDDEDLQKALEDIEDWRLLKCASFHPYREGIWIIIDADGDWCGNAPIPTRDFLNAAESIENPEAFKERLAAEAAEAASGGTNGAQDDTQTDSAHVTTLAKEKAWIEASVTEYGVWKAACTKAFASKAGTLLQFPLLPDQACMCILEICVQVKTEIASSACKHDLKRVLSCDVDYSATWLKKERVKWHPDKIQRLSHPDKRSEHKLLAECMFDSYQKLYLEESGIIDAEPDTIDPSEQDVEDSRASQFESRKDQKRRAAEAQKAKEEAERKQREEAAQKRRDDEAREKAEKEEREREEVRRKASEAAERRAKEEQSRKSREAEYLQAKEEAEAQEREDRRREAEERMNVLQARMETERLNLERLNAEEQMQNFGSPSLSLDETSAAPPGHDWEKRWRKVTDSSGPSPRTRWEQYWAPKHTHTHTPPPIPPRSPRSAAEMAYETWNLQCLRALAFDNITSIPPLPAIDITCNRPSCVSGRMFSALDACMHELRWLLRGSGRYSAQWLLAQAENWEKGKIERECSNHLGSREREKVVGQAAELCEMMTVLAALEMSMEK